MKRDLLIGALAMALAMPVLSAPTTASASCAGRKMAGTVIGGVGGALIGNSIARGGGGALIGGLGGAVVGHEIARSGCGHYHRAAYERRDYRDGGDRAPPPPSVYYDDRGAPISPSGESAPMAYGGPAAGACRTEMRSYYDSRGALVQSPVQVCAR
jgi:hypothetical protein